MICSDLMTNLGYECISMTETISRVISPYLYGDDGEHIGVFIQDINGRIKVTDSCDALMNIESRGINLTTARLNKIKAILQAQGIEMDENGEILCWASSETLPEATTKVIKGGIIASVLSLDWYSQPNIQDKFDKSVINFFTHSKIKDQVKVREIVYGSSGHGILVPVTITNKINISPNFVFSSSVHDSKSWQTAYTLLGKLLDLKSKTPERNNRYIVIDTDKVGDQLDKLSILFDQTANILPYDLRENWILQF